MTRLKKVLLIILFQLIFLSLIFAENPTVYITKTGSKYHVSTCSYLKKSKISIKLSEAIANGYTPCSRCNPPTEVSLVKSKNVIVPTVEKCDNDFLIVKKSSVNVFFN